MALRFEWDETKRRSVITKRGVDILYAARIFNGDILTRIDDRQDYGEIRLISVGVVDDECFVVVYTRQDDDIRLITAWKGGRRERERYSARDTGRH